MQLRPAQRRLLSILLLARNRPLSHHEIVDRMWPTDPPPTARNVLQVHVAGIRRTAPGLVSTTPSGYAIDLTGVSYDLDEFLDFAKASTKPVFDWSETLSVTNRALLLWRGQPFPALVHDDFALAYSAMLDELHIELLERRAECRLSLGQAGEAVAELEMLVVDHPFRERLWEYLMLGRYRSGRRSEALRAYQDLSRALGDELGIAPGRRLQLLEDEILTNSVHLEDGPPPTTPQNLPRPANSFHGRRNDVAQIGRIIDVGNVAIIGAAGVGKTRLAVEIARNQMHRFPDGVWIVELRGTADSFELIARIAAATSLGVEVHRLSDLVSLLGSRQSLVILDSCDEASEDIETFLRLTSAVDGTTRIMTTGSHLLAAPGTTTWYLEPFEVPDAATAQHAQAIDAVRLLMARVRTRWPGFQIDDRNAAQVLQLCRNAGGNPLAIELSARWVSTLGFEQTLAVGGGAIEGSAHAHLAVSHEMAAASDRRSLRASSVFVGPMSLEAFHAVAAPDANRAETAGIVARLVDSFLVVVQRGGDDTVRYAMPEAVEALAAAELDGDEDEVTLRLRHARWFASEAASRADTALWEVDTAMPDNRAALSTLLDEDHTADAAALISALRTYWEARYLTWEASHWVHRALSHPLSDEARLEVLWTGGWAAYHHHDYAGARSMYHEGLDLARTLGDRLMEGRSLFGLGRVEAPIDPPLSADLVGAALERFEGIEDGAQDRAACLMVLGTGLAWGGDSDRARAHLHEALNSSTGTVDSTVRALSLRYLSWCALQTGDRNESVALARDAERTARRVGNSRALGGALIQRALVEATWGDLRIAASSIVEALGPVPDHAEIDTALIAFGSVPALIEAGRTDVATDVFAYIDDVFERYGWMPITQRSPFAALQRSRVSGGAPSEAGDGFREGLSETLNEIARR